MDTSCTITQTCDEPAEQRAATRRLLNLQGRLVWRDARSATRFASVVIRNVSESGAFVECLGGTPIPLYRLVYLQAEGQADADQLPAPLCQGRVLAAVFRIDGGRGTAASPQGYGLRLLVEPSLSSARAKSRARTLEVPLTAVNQ